jgi:hypothetical protein
MTLRSITCKILLIHVHNLMHAMKQIKVYSILLKLVLSTNQSIQLVVLVTDLE